MHAESIYQIHVDLSKARESIKIFSKSGKDSTITADSRSRGILYWRESYWFEWGMMRESNLSLKSASMCNDQDAFLELLEIHPSIWMNMLYHVLRSSADSTGQPRRTNDDAPQDVSPGRDDQRDSDPGREHAYRFATPDARSHLMHAFSKIDSSHTFYDNSITSTSASPIL
jgi:hypothetical protein